MDSTPWAQLEALVSELAEAIRDHDPAGRSGLYSRKKIINTANEIIMAVKEPAEMPFDYSIHMAEMAALREFMELRVFDIIPNDGSISYKDTAIRIGADESLITRMASILATTGFLRQVGEEHVAHTRFSKVYADKNPQASFFQIIYFHHIKYDEAMVPYTRWPEYFRKHGYKEPVRPTHTPRSFAWGQEDKNSWEIISQDAQRLTDFNVSMATLDAVLPIVEMFDFSWIMTNAASVAQDRPLVVDVGGGKGQALKKIMSEAPELPASRLVLQDRPDVIEEVVALDEPELRAVTKMSHDFFLEQPVKGALIYYIRRIMHDWSDENCHIILSHLVQAMSPHSRVLITEQIMPNPPSALNAQMDLCILNIGGKERTKSNWLKLTSGVGLEVVRFWTTQGTEVGVIECKKVSGR